MMPLRIPFIIQYFVIPSYFFVIPSSQPIIPTNDSQQTIVGSGNVAQKNHRKFCENDFKIIEAIQSNHMNTESVAIFIDDKFDLVYRKLEIFQFVANRKAFFVENFMDSENGTDNLMSKNDGTIRGKNHKTLLNTKNREINYVPTIETALTISKTFSMAFILSNVDDITNTFHIMMKQPSLVKIVLTYKECVQDITMYENRVKNVSQQLWMKHRILHIYYIPFCLNEYISNSINVADDEHRECFVDVIYLYDAFKLYPKDIGTTRGILRRFLFRNESRTKNEEYPVDVEQSTNSNVCDDDVAQSFNDFLRINGKQFSFNLHEMDVNVSFFPTTQAYLKAETKLFSKTLTKEHLADPLSTTPDIYFGVDIEILKEFARKINFTPHVINPSDKQYYGFRQEDGSYTGALGDLLYQRTEFIMNAFFIKDYETRDLQFSSAVYTDEMCVVIRSADLIPEALLILKIFTEGLWILIGISILVFSIIYFTFIGYLNDIKLYAEKESRKLMTDGLIDDEELPAWCFYILVRRILAILLSFAVEDETTYYLQKLIEEHQEYSTAMHKVNDFIDICIKTTGIILTKPAKFIGNTNSERVLLGMLFLYTLILTGAFQGCLIQIFTTPFTYPNIENLDDLDKSGLWIGIQYNNNVVDLFQDRGGSPLSNLKHKLKYDVDDSIFEHIALYGGIGTLERGLNEPTQTMKFTRSNGQSLLNFVKECPRSYMLAFIVRRDCVFADALNEYLNRVSEGGLIVKWFRDTAFIFELESNFHYQRTFILNEIVLNLTHLEVSFWLLGLGFTIASVVFAGEIFLANCKQ